MLFNRFLRDPGAVWRIKKDDTAGLFARSGPQDFKDLEVFTHEVQPPRVIRSHFAEEDDDANR